MWYFAVIRQKAVHFRLFWIQIYSQVHRNNNNTRLKLTRFISLVEWMNIDDKMQIFLFVLSMLSNAIKTHDLCVFTDIFRRFACLRHRAFIPYPPSLGTASIRNISHNNEISLTTELCQVKKSDFYCTFYSFCCCLQQHACEMPVSW